MIRVLLIVICVESLLLVLAGMAWGWNRRGARQGPLLGELPVVPADLGGRQQEPMTGLYVGTTFAGSWQDRVVAGGLGRRADATATLFDGGVVIERHGAGPVFLPGAAVTGARLAPGLAGKVVGAGGLLVVQWRWNGHDLDTGFRADDKREYVPWVAALQRGVSA